MSSITKYEPIQFFCKVLTGKTITIHLPLDATISTLKGVIFEKEKIPADMQHLKYGGRDLEDIRSLSDYNFTKDMTIHLDLRLKGGGTIDLTFNDLTKKSKEFEFASTANDWRIVSNGFSLEATCIEKTCKAFEKRVIIKFGMGDHNIKECTLKIKCPMKIDKEGKPIAEHAVSDRLLAPIFSACTYSIIGIKRLENGKVDSKETLIDSKVSEDRWIKYDSNNDVEWIELEITTEPLKEE